MKETLSTSTGTSSHLFDLRKLAKLPLAVEVIKSGMTELDNLMILRHIPTYENRQAKEAEAKLEMLMKPAVSSVEKLDVVEPEGSRIKPEESKSVASNAHANSLQSLFGDQRQGYNKYLSEQQEMLSKMQEERKSAPRSRPAQKVTSKDKNSRKRARPPSRGSSSSSDNSDSSVHSSSQSSDNSSSNTASVLTQQKLTVPKARPKKVPVATTPIKIDDRSAANKRLKSEEPDSQATKSGKKRDTSPKVSGGAGAKVDFYCDGEQEVLRQSDKKLKYMSL